LLPIIALQQKKFTISQDPYPPSSQHGNYSRAKPPGLKPQHGRDPLRSNTPLFSRLRHKNIASSGCPPREPPPFTNDTEAFECPLATSFSKTFASPESGHQALIETRCCAWPKTRAGLHAYVWNESAGPKPCFKSSDPGSSMDPSAGANLRSTTSSET